MIPTRKQTSTNLLPPPPSFLLCIYVKGCRTAGINTNLCASYSAGNLKLKVALPRTRPHMCNGNVAPKHTRRPANPHQGKLMLTQSLAFRYVATLTHRIIKLKIKIVLLASVIRTQKGGRRVLKCFTHVLLALACASGHIYINGTMKIRV